jgi:hypothetical protein
MLPRVQRLVLRAQIVEHQAEASRSLYFSFLSFPFLSLNKPGLRIRFAPSASHRRFFLHSDFRGIKRVYIPPALKKWCLGRGEIRCQEKGTILRSCICIFFFFLFHLHTPCFTEDRKVWAASDLEHSFIERMTWDSLLCCHFMWQAARSKR